MPRIRPPHDPVTIRLDGAPVVAERGEPAAAALVAAGHLALARSPKFHRPRGPACFRGACDGCLARVDDVPNVMTCRIPATDGLRIETQNVVGWRETDLLRATDWFFPEGMNHHELFAGVPGLRGIVQGVARRVAGLGRLPTAAVREGAAGVRDGAAARRREGGVARRREVDVLVVGGGPAGMSAALELVKRGRTVEVVDDDLQWGGSARVLARLGVKEWEPLLAAFGAAVGEGAIGVRARTTAAGVYGDDVLLASEGGEPRAGAVEVVTPRTLVLAPGAHDGALAFEGNDVPGVMSDRAACRLLAHGVTPGRRVVVVGDDRAGPFGAAFALAAPSVTRLVGTLVRVAGRGRVKAVRVETAAGEREVACDALLVETPRAPAFELCAQAGAELLREAGGYRAVVDTNGRVGERTFVVGEAVGGALDARAMVQAAVAMAAVA